MPDQPDLFAKPRKFTALRGNGYAATPGGGPSGETCKTCAHRTAHSSATRKWNKCGRVKTGVWSQSTDIRLDAPACVHWAQREQ